MTLSQADHGTAGASLKPADASKTWAPWRAALAKQPHPQLSVVDGPPCIGYWRSTLFKGGPRVGIAIWCDGDGELCSLLGDVYDAGGSERYNKLAQMFPFMQAVSYDDYQFWKKNQRWPDESPAVARSMEMPETSGSPGMGHNQPPEGSFELFKGTVDDLVREAEGLIKGGGAKDKLAADRAADLADKLSKIFNTKPAAHAANDPDITQEMRETVEVYKGLTGRWVTIHKTAEIYKRVKDVVVAPFLKKQREAQQAAQRASEFGVPADAPRPVTAGGRPGTRSTGLRENKTAAIGDYAATLAYFAQSDKVKVAVQELADASVKAGNVPPGCTVVYDYKAV